MQPLRPSLFRAAQAHAGQGSKAGIHRWAQYLKETQRFRRWDARMDFPRHARVLEQIEADQSGCDAIATFDLLRIGHAVKDLRVANIARSCLSDRAHVLERGERNVDLGPAGADQQPKFALRHAKIELGFASL